MSEQSSVPVRKNDTSDSTKDYWRNGAGDHPYHRDDEPCDNAPEGGYVFYEFDRIHVPEDCDYCPDCDWSGTAVEEYIDTDDEQSGGQATLSEVLRDD